MTADLLIHLGLCSLAASIAVLLVMALRQPLRRLLGARLAYWLWLLVPVAMLASLAPAPPVLSGAISHLLPALPAAPFAKAVPAATAASTGPTMTIIELPASGPKTFDIALLVYVWLAGAAGFAAYLAFGQRRAIERLGLLGEAAGFTRAASRDAGPALIGLFRPRIILPTDFETRFDAREQRLILAHERTHLNDGHLWINGLTALIRCVNWFNPLVHLGAFQALVDQELACDAAVVARFPGERRTYAQAMLKSQLSCVSLPLGCTWPGRSKQLQERLTMIAFDKPGRARLLAGSALVGALCLGVGAAALAASAATRPAVRPAAAQSGPSTAGAPAMRAAAPPTAAAAKADAEPVAPSIIGMGCFSNSCDSRPRDDAAVAAAIKAGDAKAAFAAGGSAGEVVSAMIAGGTLPPGPAGGDLASMLKLDTAVFVNQGGALGFRADIDDGSGLKRMTVLVPPALQGVTPPAGMLSSQELANQEAGRPAGTVAITEPVGTPESGGPQMMRIAGFRTPDGTVLPATPGGR